MRYVKLQLQFLLCLALSNQAIAQGDTTTVSLRINVGVSWRSTPITNTFCVQCATIPSNYEKNIQGFGLNTGFQLYFPKSGVAIEYAPVFRYDHTNFDTWGSNKDLYSFLVDNHFNFYKYFKSGKRLPNKQVYMGLGYANINSGAGFSYVSGANVLYHSLAFHALSIFTGFPLQKNVYLEPKILYTPPNSQFSPQKHFLMASLKIYYVLHIN